MNAILPNDVQAIQNPQARIVKCDLDTQIIKNLNRSSVHYYCRASIIFDQETNEQFMNNFIEFLKQHLPKPINCGYPIVPVQINGHGASININAPLLLTREFLQCILDYANEHFAH